MSATTWNPPPAELARRAGARRRFDQTMDGEAERVEAHRVGGGDALLCSDGRWRRVLTSFSENGATASATVWVLYCMIDGEPSYRWGGGPGDLVTIRRAAS